ncbi:Helicase SKI2W [Tritrichomonas foetus]|uniref:Helicase SKI2W n=1 Tax=Tritrichomonas foetus TaxID=1144522 RepID=A0A1J4JXV8_9EUKA|nr:Helicase SKI2W [Tritrichomonas foetus]|eukprot:OHT02350.1 Helicase SKI2W [Tritrichomonas foetus]
MTQNKADELFQEALELINPIAEKYTKLFEPPTLPYKIAPFSYLGLGEFPLEDQPFEADILKFVPTLPTMTIEPKRDLITGEIISYQNLPLSTLPSDSSDINRQIGDIDDYHRGNKQNVPFFPGVSVDSKSASIDFAPLLQSLDTGMNLLTTPFSKDTDNAEALEPLPELPIGEQTVVQNPRDLPEESQGIQFHAINDKYDIENLKKDVPNMACEFNYQLDEFQARSIYRLERNECVFVSAPTSAGKTVVAQYAIALCRSHKMRALYTSPIKALSNQKFRDFSRQFGDVGIMTGDVSINREASVLIMTTEILRSMLYRGADILRDVECVIFDECHYIANDERGVVWEESIILMPPHINMVFLSATVPNAVEIASWIARTKLRPVYVEMHTERPVPLSHSLYVGGRIITMQDPAAKKKGFNGDSYQRAKNCMPEKRLGKNGKPLNPLWNGKFWGDLTRTLKDKDLLPALMFSFSQANCEKFAVMAAKGNPLINKQQQGYVISYFNRMIARLPPQDRHLPQISQMFDLLKYGIGVHHAGVLPILKEIVEILLADGYLKMLFCTSTFAMGINVPVRTCCFTNLRKFNGKEFVEITKTEYLQMSGRAGRRGLDKVGTTVLVVSDELPEEQYLRNLFNGEAEKLQSQFYIRFNMVLSMIRVQGMKMVDLLKRSLSANAIQSQVPDFQRRIARLEEQKQRIAKIDCSIGDIEDITPLTNNVQELIKLNKIIIEKNKEYFEKTLLPNSIVLFTNDTKCDVSILEKIENEGRRKKFTLYTGTGHRHLVNLDKIHTIHLLAPPPQNQKLLLDENKKRFISEFTVDKITSYSEFFKKNKNPDFLEDASRHKELLLLIMQSKCFTCAQFSEHYNISHESYTLDQQITTLKNSCKDEKIELIPLLQCYINMLIDMDYISHEQVINVKGRISIEIGGTAHEIISTELLFGNFFDDCTPEEIAALTSCLVAQRQGKKNESDEYLPNLQPKIEAMIEVGQMVQDKMAEFGISFDEDEFLSYNINPAATTPVYNWAMGQTFAEVMESAQTIPEGGLVRIIMQCNDALKNLSSAAKIMGSKTLADKFDAASECIKRDIIFAASLYLD